MCVKTCEAFWMPLCDCHLFDTMNLLHGCHFSFYLKACGMKTRKKPTISVYFNDIWNDIKNEHLPILGKIITTTFV